VYKSDLNLIGVIPAHKVLRDLSYYSSERYDIGDIIPIPIGKSTAVGVVSSISSLQNSKSSIRNLEHKLRALNSKSTGAKISRDVLQSISQLARFSFRNTAEILNLVLPRSPEIKRIETEATTIICIPSAKNLKDLNIDDRQIVVPVNKLALLNGRICEIIASDRPGAYRSIKDSGVDLRQYIMDYTRSIKAKYTERPLVDLGMSIKENKSIKLIALKGKTMISDELVKLIRFAIKEREKVYLFVARKGYSSSTICGDCGSLIFCTKCQSPLVLHLNPIRTFRCHHCGIREASILRCRECNSWKLISLGIGIERVREELRKFLPEVQATNPVIGTLSDISKLSTSIKYSAIVSLDSLFTIPDYTIREKILYDLNLLKSLTEENMIVQTRHGKEPVFDYFLNGNIIEFRQSELSKRRELAYPPYKIFIKVTHSGTEASRGKFTAFAKKLLKDYNPIVTSAFIPRIAGKYITHLILRLDPDSWPNRKLETILTQLRPFAMINVNPENLL